MWRNVISIPGFQLSFLQDDRMRRGRRDFVIILISISECGSSTLNRGGHKVKAPWLQLKACLTTGVA